MRETWWKGYLCRVEDVSSQVPKLKGQIDIRLFPLKCGQVVLDLVVLGVFRADIIVDTGSFLCRGQSGRK